MQDRKDSRRMLIGAAGLIAVAAALALIYSVFREKPAEGAKSIVIQVTGRSGETKDYGLRTDAEFLRQAMEEAEGLEFSGQESEYGMVVDTVNGERADYATDGAYWGFYVNGAYCNYGIDTQPVEDGDVFGIVYTVDSTK